MREKIDSIEQKYRQAEKIHGPSTAWIILCISLIVNILAWHLSSSYIEKRSQEKFDFKAKEITQAIHDQMLTYEQVLRGAVAYTDSSDEVTRAQWKNFIEKIDIEKNWPGIQGIGYSVPVKPEDLEEHIAQIRAEGFPDFTVKPEGKRDLYSSIIYLEPFDWRNKRAFGYDMWSNEMRRQAMKRAIETGEASASGLITLVQETDTDIQKGFLVYLPVYEKGAVLNTVEDRRKNFKCWVYAAFRTGDLMKGITTARSAPLDNLTYMEVYDEKVSSDSLLYSSNGKDEATAGKHEPIHSEKVELNVQGRKWILYIYEEKHPDSIDSKLPWFIGIAGVFIDILLFYVILSLSSVHKKAVGIAREISGEVEQKNIDLNEKQKELTVLNQELFEREARLNAIVENTADGIISLDENFTILSYNYACKEIFGYKPEEVLAHSIKKLIPQLEDTDESELFEKLNIVSKGVGQEIECINKKGKHFTAEFSMSTAHKGDHKIYVVVIRDISERKSNEKRTELAFAKLLDAKKEVEKAREEAVTSSKSKSEFLANMSHEIRTPMTAILGYIDLLKENENVKFTEAMEQIEIIEKNGDHLLTILNDILDLSKIEAGKLELEFAPFCLHELTENIKNLLNAKVKEKNLKFKVDIKYPVPASVTADLTRIRQILLNLLGNSIKFTQKGEVALTVHWHNDSSELTFEVEDSGIGMTEEQCQKVFNSFEQADTSITRNFGGTGLGLAITKRLTEMMQGKVTVESEYGKGSKFTVRIKVKEASRKLLESPPAVKTLVDFKKTGSLEGHVLLVDDNMTNLTLIGKILKKMNLQVECCMNGEEATKLLLSGKNDFDLVLMDVQMPVMDGLTAVRILKQNNYDKPVIALTANNMKGDKEKCLDAGYDDFASKPVKRKELFEMLQTHLSAGAKNEDTADSTL